LSGNCARRFDRSPLQNQHNTIVSAVAGFAVIGFFIYRYLRFHLYLLPFYNNLEIVISGKCQSVKASL
jgi:hypothetical protein